MTKGQNGGREREGGERERLDVLEMCMFQATLQVVEIQGTSFHV